jgi:hypothetical protein
VDVCESLSPEALPPEAVCLVLTGCSVDSNWPRLLADARLRMVVCVNCERQTVQVYCGYTLPAADLDSLTGLISRWLVEHGAQAP